MQNALDAAPQHRAALPGLRHHQRLGREREVPRDRVGRLPHDRLTKSTAAPAASPAGSRRSCGPVSPRPRPTAAARTSAPASSTSSTDLKGQGAMAYRARNILIAVALAAVAALLTSFYVTSYKRHVQRGEDHVTVLVAKKDIVVGASGADVAGQLSSLDVPRQERRAGRDLQRRPAGGPRRHRAHARGRAGHDPPLQPPHPRRRPGPAERHAPGALARGRPEPAARRHAQGRRQRRLRGRPQEAGRPGHLLQPRARARPEGAAGAGRARRPAAS